MHRPEKVDVPIPGTSGLSMIDGLHLITLLYVLLAIAITVACWRMAVHGHEAVRIKRLNQLGILAGLGLQQRLAPGRFADLQVREWPRRPCSVRQLAEQHLSTGLPRNAVVVPVGYVTAATVIITLAADAR